MRFAVFSDMHGNQYALSSVLEEIEKESIDQILILGDFVGYYYGVLEILKMLEKYQYHAIKGNHEDLLANAIKVGSFESLNEKYGKSHLMSFKSLSSEQLKFLITLPETIKLTIDGLRILMCHGSPWDNDFYVYPNADYSVLKRFEEYPFEFIFFGHTHYATELKTKHGVVVNPGSIGQSREIGGQAYWGILDTELKSYTQRITPYDVRALENEVLEHDPERSYNFKILRR